MLCDLYVLGIPHLRHQRNFLEEVKVHSKSCIQIQVQDSLRIIQDQVLDNRRIIQDQGHGDEAWFRRYQGRASTLYVRSV